MSENDLNKACLTPVTYSPNLFNASVFFFKALLSAKVARNVQVTLQVTFVGRRRRRKPREDRAQLTNAIIA